MVCTVRFAENMQKEGQTKYRKSMAGFHLLRSRSKESVVFIKARREFFEIKSVRVLGFEGTTWVRIDPMLMRTNIRVDRRPDMTGS